jgi:hypothetical protein
MADLHKTVEDVRARIAMHRGKGIGEQNTKSVLINPVLRALGWDMEDLDEVVLEFKRKSMENPVDYALMLQRTPRLFIEAKPLDGNLNDPKWAGQIMAYATVAGVQWVALTDGDQYWIYNSHAPVPVEQKLFKSTRVSADHEAEETLQLLSKERMEQGLIGSLWQAHFIDQQLQAAIADLVGPEPAPSLVRLVRKRVPGLALAQIRDGLARMEVRFDIPSAPRLSERKLPAVAPPKEGQAAKGTPWRNVTMTDLLAEGVLKPPVDLQRSYKGKLLTARIELDGKISFGGDRYDSLSTAAGQARRTVIGSPEGRLYPQTNGWTFWQFVDDDGRWQQVDVLRRRFWSKTTRPTTSGNGR